MKNNTTDLKNIFVVQFERSSIFLIVGGRRKQIEIR